MTARALTEAEYEAIRWFLDHNGDGTFAGGNGNVMLAGGEMGPFNKRTWNNLRDLGLIEFYDKRRARVTDAGRRLQ